LFQHALTLSENLCTKKAPESEQTAKNAKLKLLVKSPAQKIADLEVVCVDLKHEKENVIADYQRLAEKHKTFTEKAEREKMELAKTHTTELAKTHGELDEETPGYTNYRLNVRHRFHELHETMALSFDEVKAQCLPFPARGVKVEEMIDWVPGEVKTVPDTVWHLNDNFIILAIEGILDIINGKGCKELSRLRGLATSSDPSIL
jgi:hypothetical protein